MKRWKVWAAVVSIVVAAVLWQSKSNKKFAGMVATGWGGNWQGNLPAVAPQANIVATATATPNSIYSGPGVPAADIQNAAIWQTPGAGFARGEF